MGAALVGKARLQLEAECGRMPANHLLAMCHASPCLGHVGEEEPSEARWELRQHLALFCSAGLGVAHKTGTPWPLA